ncbi:hypothetical protein B5S27_g1321 [[Candida] boidinii]|nr:hypothetical protein B5S27_g1321 [[Candida] boidinii]
MDNKKLTNRESINIKKNLQEKFQLSLSNLDSKVLSWLPSPKSTRPPSTTTTTVTSDTNAIRSNSDSTENNRDQFLNSPIIGQGCGISFDTSNSNNDSDEQKKTFTVGDFINGYKSSASSSTSKNGKQRAAVVSEGIAKLKRKDNMNNTSKAMSALKNKLRNDNRNKFRNENQNQSQIQNQTFKNKNQTASQLRFQSLAQRNDNSNKNNNTNNKIGSSANHESSDDEDDDDEVLLRKSKSSAKKTNLKSKRPF